jgi:FtsP/CotA-like multicopper oxidase with cupredoxin domain
LRRSLQCDLEADDLDLVFDERSADLAIFVVPVDGPEFKPVNVTQEPRAAIGERVDVVTGAGGREAIELRTAPALHRHSPPQSIGAGRYCIGDQHSPCHARSRLPLCVRSEEPAGALR